MRRTFNHINESVKELPDFIHVNMDSNKKWFADISPRNLLVNSTTTSAISRRICIIKSENTVPNQLEDVFSIASFIPLPRRYVVVYIVLSS
jgi:hypothetical protein